MAFVFVITGNDEGKRFDLTTPVVSVGRDAANTLVLHDTEVSRRHAEFRRRQDGGFAVADLGSSNGTFVNGRPVKEAALRSGDQVQFGQSTLVYSAGRPEAGDLASKISLISRADLDAPSAIVKTVNQNEGSRVLAQPDQARSPWLKNALANLAVLYQASQATSHILDPDQLLDRIMDLAFQTILADRGCILLADRDGDQLEPKAVRFRSGADKQEKISVSRSIVDHVLKEIQGVLVSDASRDTRFAAAQSIARFGIREVICVPLKGRHDLLGVLYLDTRTTSQQIVASGNPTGKLTEDHLTLAAALGHQAALALEDTRYHQAMMQAERLAAVGQTIAAISHHVKNILQGLRSGSDLIRLGLGEKNDGLVQQGWKVVEKNQGRIYDLVMDMLTYSKDREPNIEATDLNAVVAEVVELVQGRVEQLGVKLTVKPDAALPQVGADTEGVHRALLNVVGNALDALAEREHPALTIQTAFDEEGPWARIVVSDNGPGIPPEKQQEIFKPFVSSKGARGTGLGLAVSRKILREHGGDILLQSQVGKGSRFTLRLPGTPPPPSANLDTIHDRTMIAGEPPAEEG